MRRAVLLTNADGRTILALLVAPNGRRYFLKRPTSAERPSRSLVEVRP